MTRLIFKIIFTTSLIVVTSYSYAKNCIQDIFSAGVSAKSVIYSVEHRKGIAKLATNEAKSIELKWINFCPKIRFEFIPYLTINEYSFTDSTNSFEFQGVKEKVNLYSAGLKTYFPVIFSTGKPVIDLGIREELLLQARAGYLESSKVQNLVLLAGLSRRLWKLNSGIVSGEFSLGPLFPMEESNLGYKFKANVNYFYRYSSKLSLIFDTYYSKAYQDFNDISIATEELGLLSMIIFRL